MKNANKVLVIIAITFLIAVIVSCVIIFSIRKLDVQFAEYGDSYAVKIQNELEERYYGKSLIFLKEEAEYSALDDYPYYVVTYVEKDFPNVVKFKVEKRVEKLRVYSDGKVYVLDGNGIVLNDTGKTETETNVADVTFDGIEVTVGIAGKMLETTDDELFFSLLGVINEISLNDIVEEIKVVVATEKQDVEFTTYTGVKIIVIKAGEFGKEKIEKAFELYGMLADYEKTCSEIQSFRMADGTIRADWISPK